jgi:transcription elongation factor GreB
MKSNLITRAGHDKLVAELQHLWHEERPEITRKVNWAASLGDRSENAKMLIIHIISRFYVR